MYVKNHMQKNPIVMKLGNTVSEARTLLRDKHFRHLPITDESGHLLGMVTDRDIRSVYPSTILDLKESDKELEKVNITPLEKIMSRDVSVLSPFSTLDDALFILDRKRVGAIPVVEEDGRVVGIFSIRDLIRAYKELFGLGEKGSALVAVKSDEKPRPLSRITHVLEDHDIHFSRIVRKTDIDDEKKNVEVIYIRVNTFNIHNVHSVLEEAGFSLMLPPVQS